MPFGAETMENDPCTVETTRNYNAGTGTRQTTSAQAKERNRQAFQRRAQNSSAEVKDSCGRAEHVKVFWSRTVKVCWSRAEDVGNFWSRASDQGRACLSWRDEGAYGSHHGQSLRALISCASSAVPAATPWRCVRNASNNGPWHGIHLSNFDIISMDTQDTLLLLTKSTTSKLWYIYFFESQWGRILCIIRNVINQPILWQHGQLILNSWCHPKKLKILAQKPRMKV